MYVSTISGKLEESDFLAAVFLHQRDRVRRRWTLILIFLPLLTAATLAFSVRLGVCLLLGGLLGMMFDLAMLIWRRPTLLRRHFREMPLAGREFSLSWDESRLDWRVGSETWQMDWSDYRRIKADEQMILLYPAEDRFHMLPRRCFADAAQAEALLRLARERIAASAVSTSS